MLTIAIVDDELLSRQTIKKQLDAFLNEKGISFQVAEFDDGSTFLGNYSPIYDLIFMDIEMPNINGIDACKSIRKIDTNVMIIFVTNMPQYAIAGYEVEAFDFMVKPINSFSFALKMGRAIPRLNNNKGSNIQIRHDREIISINTNDILYLESQGHYVIFHLKDRDIEEYCTLKEAKSRIHTPNFAQCNRCYYINLHYITHIYKDTVHLGEDVQLLISRPQRRTFLDEYAAYLGGKNNDF